MNQKNQTIMSIRNSIEMINKVLPTITNADVKQSLNNQKKELHKELEKLLQD